MQCSLLVFSKLLSTKTVGKLLLHVKLKALYKYSSLEKPPAPSQVQLIKATTNSFHVKWDEVPTVEGYLLQLNTDLPYQAVPPDSSAAPNMLGNLSVMLKECMSAHVCSKNILQEALG